MSVIPEQKNNVTLYTFLNKKTCISYFWVERSEISQIFMKSKFSEEQNCNIIKELSAPLCIPAVDFENNSLYISVFVQVPFLSKYIKYTSGKLILVWFYWFVFLLPALIALLFSIASFFIALWRLLTHSNTEFQEWNCISESQNWALLFLDAGASETFTGMLYVFQWFTIQCESLNFYLPPISNLCVTSKFYNWWGI